MKRKLIAVALIAVLICVGLGNSVACSPTTRYDLIINSTAGGNVTMPGEGTYTYNAGTVVNLVATPDADYRFVEWTGHVSTIANVSGAATNITMNGDCTITANFSLNITIIGGVPDTNQPPTATLPSTNTTNYCAPMAMVNIVYYWDVVMGHYNAQNVTQNVTDDFIPETLAEYLGYFMDTNNTGSPARANGNGLPAAKGTYAIDIGPGAWEFVRWDAANKFLTPPPALPAGKLGYNWTMTPDFGLGFPAGFPFYKTEIDAGRPLVVCFFYWNPESVGINFTDLESGETIDVFKWGGTRSSSEDPEEQWNFEEGEGCIGHAVTGVGYILDWDPDGSGPLPEEDYVIVHDNWPTTPRNVAIPWDNWNSNHAADPGL